MSTTPTPIDPDAPVYVSEIHLPTRTIRGSVDVLPDGEYFVTLAVEGVHGAPYVCADVSDAAEATLLAVEAMCRTMRAALAGQEERAA